MSQIHVISSSRATNERWAAIDRRGFLTTAAAGLATAALGSVGRVARAQQVVDGTTMSRRYGPNAEPVRYPDPDVIVLDKRFAKIKIGNSPIRRLHTGMLWAEGPAWNGVGKYLVWSDIPNDVQLRWLEGRRSRQRDPPARPAIPMATLSIPRGDRSRASTATAGSFATSTTARRPSWPTASAASH